ncbi:MAG: acyl-ACP--UDP-N-acetylglucosamine O-acyltransferase [Deltaproteobacteria bacterium]|nr:acyl-ACP--UDP-N-acetylglucosamine O-acyltransferase [Deltaproteobacteria bacterium]
MTGQEGRPAGAGVAVHPSAHVSPDARLLGPGTEIGPGAVVGKDVVVGPGTQVGPYAILEGLTVIGRDNRIGPHAVVGAPAQVRRGAEGGRLVVGDGNTIREFVTIHAGSAGGVTRLGDRSLLMAYVHVAHDCELEDELELANGVQLAGHVVVGHHAVIGGLAAVHQLVRIGAGAMVGAGSMVSQDVLPHALVSGDRARLYGVNTVGLRRRGADAARRRELERAFRMLRSVDTLAHGIDRVRGEVELTVEVRELLQFLERGGRRGYCRPSAGGRGSASCDG